MKKRLSISLEEKVISTLDQLKEEKFNDLPSRSALIEYYLKKGMTEDVKVLQESRGVRVLL